MLQILDLLLAESIDVYTFGGLHVNVVEFFGGALTERGLYCTGVSHLSLHFHMVHNPQFVSKFVLRY